MSASRNAAQAIAAPTVRRRFSEIACGLALISGALLAHRVDAQVLPSATAEADPPDIALSFLAHLEHGDADRALQMSTPRLRAALTAERLNAIWQALPAQVGPCGPRGTPWQGSVDGHPLIRIDLHCSRIAVEARISIDNDAVAGFFIGPATPVSKPSATLLSNDTFTESEIRIGTGDQALPATLTLPRRGTAFAAVVLVHGSGPHDRDETIGPNKPFADLAHGLAERGIAVLRYDKRTWLRPQDFSDGKFSVDRELVDDALLATKTLRDDQHTDPTRIFVLGHSLGALMAPRIGQRAPWLAGLLLMAAPARALQDIVPDQRRYLAALDDGIDPGEQAEIDELDRQRAEVVRFDPDNPPPHPLMLGLPSAYWADLRRYDPIAIARTLSMPILLLQGGRDYQVSVDTEYSKWQDVFASDHRVSLKLYPTLSHLFMPGSQPPRPSDYDKAAHVDAQVIGDIVDWIVGQKAGA